MNRKPGEDQKIFLSVIIPAFNEEARIARTLDEISSYLDPEFSNEIIIVDDGSGDGTAAAAGNFAAGKKNVRVERNGTNMGKGFSLRRGVSLAAGELCLMMDADHSVSISEAGGFIGRIREGYDIVIASRHMGQPGASRINTIKLILGRVFNSFIKAVFRLKYRDTQCGFKLMRTSVAKKIFSRCRINRFAFDVEMLHIAEKRGAKILEAPVSCNNIQKSKFRLVSDSAVMLKDVLLLRIRSSFGRIALD